MASSPPQPSPGSPPTTTTSTPPAPALPPTMRAWQFTSTHGGLEKNLKLNGTAALPPHDAKALGRDRVLVKVVAAALNPVDYKIAELPVVGRLAIRTPSSPGLDFAGRVVAVGVDGGGGGGGGGGAPSAEQEDSVQVQVGQMVFGRLDQPTRFGALAEYTVARRAGLAVVPEGVAARDAAGSARRPRVFINGGSGGTGVWGIQIAKALGCRVVASCSGKNAELCRSLGADEVLDYTKEDVLGALKKMASSTGTPPTATATGATGGTAGSPDADDDQKFDLVVDNVGTADSLYWQCHHYTSPGAKYVQVGAGMSARAVLQLALKALWPGFLGGGKRKFHMMMVSSDPAQLAQIAQWMVQGKVKAVVDEVVPMEDAPRAFEKLKTGHARGKIVVAVSE
ncbi:hypothetical protein CLAIMM_14838 [Cladophialophora immunda]|nr:hypothetical protein CLAIMM_14838 [Cladophialophora immunda]